MNKFILAAFLTLLACQSSDGQLIILQVIYSLWAFCGFTISTVWSILEITTATVTNTVISLQSTTLTTIILQNSQLGLQASTSSSQLNSINTTIAAMQSQSSSATQMDQVNSMMSESTITLAYTSSTRLSYLVLRVQTSCVGRNVLGSPDLVPGYDPTYANPSDLSTVGMQAQAVIAFAFNISTEVLNYCQQYSDISTNVDKTCTTCPTMEECDAVALKWENATILINAYTDVTLTNTTFIRYVNVTVQQTLIDAIRSLNSLNANMTTCAKCLNTGCTKNKFKARKSCSRAKSNGSMKRKDREKYCKEKNKSDHKRRGRNLSRIRKQKARKSNRRKRANRGKARGHWRGTFNRARQMSDNFQSNASSTAIPNALMRNQMIIYGFFFGNFTSISSNVTDQVTQNATDEANAASDAANQMIADAEQEFSTDVFNFTSSRFYPQNCSNYLRQAAILQFSLNEDMQKCSALLDNVTQQMLVNISYTYTAWIKQVNYYSNCHDRCVARYCPFLSFGRTTAIGVCWTLKRLFPRLYDTRVMVNNYEECKIECQTEIEVATVNITITGNYLMECNHNATAAALEDVEQCVNSTLADYRSQLADIEQQWEECAAEFTTTTSTSTTTSTTEETTSTTETTTTVAPVICISCSLQTGMAFVFGGMDFLNNVAPMFVGCVCESGTPTSGNPMECCP